MNPFREPDPAKVLHNQFFAHPAASASTDLSCARIEQMQGIRNTWYCGSYLTRPWVHEQALASGVELAERMRQRLGGGEAGAAGAEARVPHLDDFLRSIPLFEGLDPFALADVQLAAERFSLEAGGLLFRQHDMADGAHLIATGAVRVAARTLGDETVALTTLGPGSLIGEMALIDDGRRSASIEAVEPTTGYFISRDRFDAMRASGRPAAFEVLDRVRVEVARRALATIEAIATDDDHPAAARLHRAGTVATLTPHAAEPLVASLVELAAFRHLSVAEAATILALCTAVPAERGTTLARRGDPPDQLFLVLRGAVRLGLTHDGGVEQLVLHGPGTLAGLPAMMAGEPHPGQLDMREDGVVLAMERRHFEALRHGHSTAAFKLFDLAGRQLARDLRALSRYPGRAKGLQAFTRIPEPAHV